MSLMYRIVCTCLNSNKYIFDRLDELGRVQILRLAAVGAGKLKKLDFHVSSDAVKLGILR